MSNNVSLYNIHRSCTMYRAVSSMYICPNSLLYIQGEVVQFSKCSSEGSVVFLEMNMDTPYECALINRKLRSRNIFITVQSYAEYSYTRNMHTSGKNESSLIHCSRERAHHQKSCRRCSAVCRCSPAPTGVYYVGWRDWLSHSSVALSATQIVPDMVTSRPIMAEMVNSPRAGDASG